jgi:hypothetical protein
VSFGAVGNGWAARASAWAGRGVCLLFPRSAFRISAFEPFSFSADFRDFYFLLSGFSGSVGVNCSGLI